MERNEYDYNELFEGAISYPDHKYGERLEALVGLDNYKSRIVKLLSVLVNPDGINKWAKKHYKKDLTILINVLRRPPLIVFEGDVGSGKTELATTIGDKIAREEKLQLILFPLSLSTRGEGRVGQMTKLISNAFTITLEQAKKMKASSGKSRGALILLVDEADSLAQSREIDQMHHEDRAGVNAFIRGIDQLGNGKLPVAVILCTNRINALDPAVKRRAADILTFGRPDEIQREAVLSKPLAELGFSKREITEVIALTGPNDSREYGFTFSDLTQRFLPSVVLNAYPTAKITFKNVMETAKEMKPTAPFNGMKNV